MSQLFYVLLSLSLYNLVVRLMTAPFTFPLGTDAIFEDANVHYDTEPHVRLQI